MTGIKVDIDIQDRTTVVYKIMGTIVFPAFLYFLSIYMLFPTATQVFVDQICRDLDEVRHVIHDGMASKRST